MKEKILLIQSTETQSNGTKQHLESSGYQVVWARSGLTAVAMARNGAIDLILLDVALPDIEGLDLCHRFRGRNDTHSIPIILMVGRGYTPDRSAAKSLGPDDYLTKPYTGVELDTKIAAVLGARTAGKTPEPVLAPAPMPVQDSVQSPELRPKGESPQKTRQGTISHLRLVAKGEVAVPGKQNDPVPSPVLPFHGTGDAVIDPATGLFGRSQFEAMLSKDFKRAVRFKQHLSCMLIDLEGQDVGQKADEAMVKQIIQVVQETIREVDTAAWWSGKSFIVLLPNTIRNDAVQAAARIFEAVAMHSITWPDSTKVSMNIGVAGLPDKGIDTEQKLIEAAVAACSRAQEFMVPSPEHALFLKQQAISHHSTDHKEEAMNVEDQYPTMTRGFSA